jgi:hypothetical protein
MNFFQFGASCSFPDPIFFNWRKPSRASLNKDEARRDQRNIAKLPELLRKG